MSPTPSNERVRAFRTLASTGQPPELGAGPRPGVRPAAELNRELQRFALDHGLDPSRALRLRALTLLYHDQHDPAHDLVQDLSDADGALIHGILHRREPDYWNARYWFRRCETHPLFALLAPQVLAAATEPWERSTASALTLPGSFDPFAFTDECERAAPLGEIHAKTLWLRRLQDLEFYTLAELLLA